MNDKLSTKRKPIPLPIKIVFFIILGLIILGVIVSQSFIYVSPIKGRVVDAETGKPMQGVNVRAGRVTGYLDPAGGSFRTFKIFATKTDANGEFILPRTIKPKIPIIENYQGVNTLFYEHDYACQYIERRAWRDGGKTKYYEIALKRIDDDRKFNENLETIRGWLFYKLPSRANRDNDYEFMATDFKIFFEKYPNSHFTEENLRKLALFCEIEKRDYKSALKINEEFVNKYPYSPVVNNAKEDIQRLKKNTSRTYGGGKTEQSLGTVLKWGNGERGQVATFNNISTGY